MAEDVEAFVQKQELKKPTLIGHSMGAKTAMVVALRKKTSISALIPVDNAPVDAALKSDFNVYVKGMRAVADARVTKQSEADIILKEYEESLPIRQYLLTNLVRDRESGIYSWRVPLKWLASSLDKMGDFPFTNPDEQRYEGPTLVVRGTKSRYVADEMLPIIGRFFPNFELRDINAGHWVISEQPEEFRRGESIVVHRRCLLTISQTLLSGYGANPEAAWSTAQDRSFALFQIQLGRGRTCFSKA